MNKIRFLIAVLLACLSQKTVAQEQKWEKDPSYSDGKRHKEFMLNVTPLVAQFVPFNGSTFSKLNLFDYQYRKLKNGKGFRWGFGVNLDTEFNNTELQFLYLRVGYTRRVQLSKHFHVARSFDLNLFSEELNGQAIPTPRTDFSGAGASYSVGIEYSFNKHISLSTEGTLFWGIINANGNGMKIRFIPPVGLFFHVKI